MDSDRYTVYCPEAFYATEDNFSLRVVDRRTEIIGHRSTIVTSRVKFNSHSIHSTSIVEGDPEPDWVYFSIRKTPQSSFQINRSAIERGMHALSVCAGGSFVATICPGFNSYAIGVRKDLLYECDLWSHNLPILEKTAIYTISEALFRAANREFYLIETLGLDESELETRVADVFATILVCLDREEEVGTNTRLRIIDKAIGYIRANPRRVSPLELCEVVHCSVRTLQYAFRKTFGISPKKFIDRYRLSLLHSVLVSKGSAADITIQEVASGFGFQHAGNLSRSYRELFFQLPSETKLRETPWLE
ncbi:MAG: helix-turn-helix domain-containing protein [Pseudomonadales bacterium]